MYKLLTEQSSSLLVEGKRLTHPVRGPGTVTYIDRAATDGKVFGISYDSGEFHRYSGESAAKLRPETSKFIATAMRLLPCLSSFYSLRAADAYEYSTTLRLRLGYCWRTWYAQQYMLSSI